MANQIPTEDVCLPWDQTESHEVEIGMGIDWLNGCVAVKFSKHVLCVLFTEENLKELIAALSANHALLSKGRPPGM